jgi:protein tyrosine/serine phosphatase
MMASSLQNGPDQVNTTPPPTHSASTQDSAASAFHLTSFQPSSTENPPSPPFIHTEGVPNFRDLGGYPCYLHGSDLPFPLHKSYITRPLTLFRSAQLTGITTQGANTLSKDLKIRRLYDLRSEREVNNQSQTTETTDIDGVERVLVPVFRDENYSPEGLARKFKNYTAQDEDVAHRHSAGFVRAYRDILLNAGPAYTRVFEHIRDYDLPDESGGSIPEPLLFRCAAGKDRTGIFAALVLRLCGVQDEVIAWEYSITEKGLGPWREVIISHMMKGGEPGSGTPAMTREEAERAVSSRKNNMLVLLSDVLDKEFGGVERYMQEVCKLSNEAIASIRSRLIVEGHSRFGDGTGYWKPRTIPDRDEISPLGLAKDDNGRKREQKVMTG